MNLSMKWLNAYVNINKTPKEYAQDMTMSGSKVEGYEIEGHELSNIVVGKVLEIKPHTDSDHLVICQIDVGQNDKLQIVTGASNLEVGNLVPVALDNSVVFGGKKIKKGKLRGEVSEGMLCSLEELGLTVNDFPYAIEDGIFVIEEACELGQDIRSAIGFDDVTVEFEITPNRPDCLSMIGLARETAATYNVPFNLLTPAVKGNPEVGNVNDLLEVEVLNTELCPRYIAKAVKNVKIEPSPRWLRERLRACGVRPINNLVDITNYVMLEYGQPLHAFDANLLYLDKDKHKIIVRNAKEGEEIQTLDGVDRKLDSSMLVIADAKNPVAVAGVMGGEHSGIQDNTTTVIFESANFARGSVRSTSKILGLRTESSGKYEKGLDPQNTYGAIMRACELVEMLSAGDVLDGIIDVNNSSKEITKLVFDTNWINSLLGLKLTEDEIGTLLKRVGLTVKKNAVLVPSFRDDIKNQADIAEEVARIYGYDKIPTAKLSGVAEGKLTPKQKFERTIHKTLQACGGFEVCTYSFISPKYYDKINISKDDKLRDCVVITNPLGEDTSVMRTTTLPSMLEVLSKNFNNRNPQFFGYEVSNIYINQGQDVLPDERLQITLGMYGDENVDFFSLKGVVEKLFERIGLKDFEIEACKENKTFHPGRTAEVTVDGKLIGLFGEAHPLVLENYEIETKAYIAQFDLMTLFEHCKNEVEYKPLPKYPATTRDLSLICDEGLPINTIQKAIQTSAGKYLEELKLFDVYNGHQIEHGKKSVSYSLILRSDTATLTDVEIDSTMKKVTKALEKINVLLRS